MTIRGGGDPRYKMVFYRAVLKNGPAAPELRHRCACCIMVQIHGDLPHTSLPRDLRAWLGELASESIVGCLAPRKKGLTRPSKPAAGARDRQGQVAARSACGPPLTVPARGGPFEAGRDEEMVASWPNQEMRKRTTNQA